MTYQGLRNAAVLASMIKEAGKTKAVAAIRQALARGGEGARKLVGGGAAGSAAAFAIRRSPELATLGGGAYLMDKYVAGPKDVGRYLKGKVRKFEDWQADTAPHYDQRTQRYM